MRRALELAERAVTDVLPNPVVGCVLLSPAGDTVGEGRHERYGHAHAEVNALRAAGAAARGATAVVTLEPCNHTGNTGPCAQALITAGVARVVIANTDPWAPASGGADTLRAAGIEVVTGVLADEAADVNRVWLTGARNGRPFVTFKAGMTIDGRVAAPDGTSRWITSAESRADVHRLRQRVDTMLVGSGTVLADDPLLTVRDARRAPTAPTAAAGGSRLPRPDPPRGQGAKRRRRDLDRDRRRGGWRRPAGPARTAPAVVGPRTAARTARGRPAARRIDAGRRSRRRGDRLPGADHPRCRPLGGARRHGRHPHRRTPPGAARRHPDRARRAAPLLRRAFRRTETTVWTSRTRNRRWRSSRRCPGRRWHPT